MKIHKYKAGYKDHECGQTGIDLAVVIPNGEYPCCSSSWKKVTCKNCLKHKKVRKTNGYKSSNKVKKTI